MTKRVTLPRIGTEAAWRRAARGVLSAGVPPEDLRWTDSDAPQGLFDAEAQVPPATREIRVPRAFAAMSNAVIWHSDADRFDRLYAFLWRLQKEPRLIADRGDPALAHLRRMEKAVHRCKHKMKAFVRFREIGDPGATRRSFAAWFEPTHHTVEFTATFFARRFADMDWRIFTPDVSAIFEDGRLRFALDVPRPELPEDASEGLWVTYFRNIFNPARLKVQAMTSEMPKKYWHNMPEAASIPELIAGAPARARAMAAAAPTLPPARTTRVQAAAQAEAPDHWSAPKAGFAAALAGCTRCPLHSGATQAVQGEGPETAELMIVGEQPGDQEDLQGRPFVGPAGQALDAALQAAGVSRAEVYLTNAVKHFKYVTRGKRRLHQRPNSSEIAHCRWWLDAELARLHPRIVLALGAVAAQALTGDGARIMARRGQIEQGRHGGPVLISLHPAHILRTPDRNAQMRLHQALRDDIATAHAITSVGSNVSRAGS
ncbi:UdgX family uracil-DNA binding protein [Roseobacter sinensis]|uniref:Type-4 uracil-DNA glycosylase n=1 Tax=Roseobacter sinensis TaxID=2931391 RepID=A0ABT3BF08_9RHOB|nr:UdgX family uracil-DNA binding protein [Roseobacter sp. WL0113]MCV3272143.1 UdgX family uracil-DNA binding protein [Roseobacter sp. WL0113]